VVYTLTDVIERRDFTLIFPILQRSYRDFADFNAIFTARCYASAVLAMALCPSVCPSVRLSVRHKSEFY